jgi:HEAT repeat protein/plasmid stability protein
MPNVAMLENLDDIDWSRLSHAYGPATDVPGWIRDLASAGDVEGALYGLYASIVHQGTVYDASARVVPFLIELLQTDGVPTKPQILNLLACLGSGSGYEKDVRNARKAVGRGTALYVRLLQASERDIRMTAPFVLATCIDSPALAEEGLIRGIARESDSRIKASMIIGLVRLWRHVPAADAERRDVLANLWSPNQAPVVRLAAALGSTELEMEPADTAVIVESAAAGLSDFPDPPWSVNEAVTALSRATQATPAERRQLLAKLLDHADPKIASPALYAIETVCRTERFAAPHFAATFARLLRHTDLDIRRESARMLVELAPFVGDVLDGIVHDALADPETRVYGVMVLAKRGDPRAIPLLQAMLEDSETRSHGFYALDAFLRFGSEATALVPTLRYLLGEKSDSYPRLLDMLGAIGPGAGAATTAVIAALASPHPFTRFHAAKALGQIEPPAADALPALATAVTDSDPRVRAHAAFSLWQLGGPYHLAARTLVDVIAENRQSAAQAGYWGCANAAEFLGRLVPPVQEAVPLLVELLHHWHNAVTVRAAQALWRLTGQADQALPVLLRELKRSPEGLLALECLEEMGPLAITAVPILRKALTIDAVVDDYHWTDRIIELEDSFRTAAARVLEGLERQVL